MLSDYTTDQVLTFYGLNPPVPPIEGTSTLYPIFRLTAKLSWNQVVGISLITIAIGAFFAAYWPLISLETSYQTRKLAEKFSNQSGKNTLKSTIASVNAANSAEEFNPLKDPDGEDITPVNRDYSLIVPKVGINAPIIAGVNPVNTAGYNEALKKGIAHSSLSYYPNENGTVYLFSHSTNYEWFIKDLNAVFYHLKNITTGDDVVIMYNNDRYTYRIREKKVVSKQEINYLLPQQGVRTLILQTCWPPGTVNSRLLIFAELVDIKNFGKFSDVQI